MMLAIAGVLGMVWIGVGFLPAGRCVPLARNATRHWKMSKFYQRLPRRSIGS